MRQQRQDWTEWMKYRDTSYDGIMYILCDSLNARGRNDIDPASVYKGKIDLRAWKSHETTSVIYKVLVKFLSTHWTRFSLSVSFVHSLLIPPRIVD